MATANGDDDFSFPATNTVPPPSFFESPPLWQHLSSSTSRRINCENFEDGEFQEYGERFDLFSLPELKGNSCFCHDDDGGERMDVLWEDLNEEFSNCGGRLMEQSFDPLSPGREVKMSCVRIKGLKLSKANGILLSGLKPGILVFLEVLKKIFVMHNSRRSIKKSAW